MATAAPTAVSQQQQQQQQQQEGSRIAGGGRSRVKRRTQQLPSSKSESRLTRLDAAAPTLAVDKNNAAVSTSRRRLAASTSKSLANLEDLTLLETPPTTASSGAIERVTTTTAFKLPKVKPISKPKAEMRNSNRPTIKSTTPTPKPDSPKKKKLPVISAPKSTTGAVAKSSRHTSDLGPVLPAEKHRQSPLPINLTSQPLPDSVIMERLELIVKDITQKITEKQKVLAFFERELRRMQDIFEKVIRVEEDKHKVKKVENVQKEEGKNREEKLRERLIALQEGPFNIVFHGVQTDWIEAEMVDDPEFQRDILELRMKKLLKEEVGLIREVPIVDVFRYVEGPRVKGAPPVIVSFKNRKDKEQIMWRCKDRLRKAGILVTEDSTARLKRAKEEEKVKAAEDKRQAAKKREEAEAEERRHEKELYKELDLDFLF